MNRIFILLFLFTSIVSLGQEGRVKIGLLKYNGGGDWYSNPTSLPNLIRFCNQNIGTNIEADYGTVEVGSPTIFNFPFVHLTGHGNIVLSKQEALNLRQYLMAGGFLHADDNYGLDQFFRRELKKIFPDKELVELPKSHELFSRKYAFPNGLPKVHEHDNRAPQAFAIFHEGRMLLLYTFESDLGDGWESQEVHSDSEITRMKALKMGANIIDFVFNGQ